MRKELDINVENAWLIVNRLRGDMPAELKAFTDKLDVPLLGTIPANEELAEFEFSGKPLVELGDESPVYRAVERMMGQVLKVK
jgi:CO dehydrogenase nickel-insertion accessory protein CooC1